METSIDNIDIKSLNLYGKPLIETAILDTPIKLPNIMKDEACYIFVKQGGMQTFGATGSEIMKINESVLMKCGHYIAKSLPHEGCCNYQAIIIHLKPDVLKKVYQNDLPDFLTEGPKIEESKELAKIKRDKLFTRYMDGILFYFENPELVNDEILILKLKELLLLLANTKDAPVVHQILSNLFVPEDKHFKDVVEANIFSDINIQDLAVLSNHSLSSFKREFKRTYGDTPARYIRGQKLEKAAKLLSHSEDPIGSIAYDCGFNDLSHFTKVFKKKFGKLPSEWKMKQSA